MTCKKAKKPAKLTVMQEVNLIKKEMEFGESIGEICDRLDLSMKARNQMLKILESKSEESTRFKFKCKCGAKVSKLNVLDECKACEIRRSIANKKQS